MSEEPPEDPKHLLLDRSLLKMWWRLNVTGRNGVRNSRLIFWAIALLAVIDAFYLFWTEVSVLPEQIRTIALNGQRSLTSVLSFLLAGFMFLISMTNAELLRQMFKHREPGTQLDYLRYNTYSLLSLFAEFIFGVLFFSAIIVFGQSGGGFGKFLSLLPASVHDGILQVAFLITSILFLFFMFRLKTFVTTVYQFAMTGLVFKFDELDALEHEESEVDANVERQQTPEVE